jgi:oligopeptide transport system permease protein
MLRLVARRALTAIPTLLVLVTLTFFLMRAAPGGPFDHARVMPPAIEQAMAAAYHLDEPLWSQYGRYLRGLLRGDLGPSFQYEGYTVAELIASGFPVSALLGICALVIGVLLGCAIGIAAALRHRGATDLTLMAFAMIGTSVPNFVLAPLSILLFAVVLGWLPAGGWSLQEPSTLVLPVLALAAPVVASVARLMRGSMLEVLQAGFIRTARAKGLPAHRVLLRHALKPAFLPVLSYLGPAAAGIITGSVVIEQVFGLPGIGRYFVQGALNRDYTLVLGVVLFYGVLIILLNLVVDLLYSAIDPRLRQRA